MNGRMSIHDVVGVKTSTHNEPTYKSLDIVIKTADGSTFELVLFADDISKLEIKHANEG
jgi:hypothetical protein